MKFERVEFRISFYGNAIITLDDQNIKYECGQSDVSKLFGDLLGKRVFEQYSDGVTIFLLGTKQVEKIKKYFK